MTSVCFQFPLSNYFFEIVMTVTDFPKTRITVKILLDNKIFGGISLSFGAHAALMGEGDSQMRK